ncbi:MAG: FkbM family methyltransferase [Roseiarcus sp.]
MKNAMEPCNRYIVHGIVLEIPRSLVTPAIHDALESGYYEHPEADELGELIQDGEVILEIGAGVGLISTIAARNPRTRKVYAIEANPNLIPIIKRTHALNQVEASVFNEVLGDANGIIDFAIHKDF